MIHYKKKRKIHYKTVSEYKINTYFPYFFLIQLNTDNNTDNDWCKLVAKNMLIKTKICEVA